MCPGVRESNRPQDRPLNPFQKRPCTNEGPLPIICPVGSRLHVTDAFSFDHEEPLRRIYPGRPFKNPENNSSPPPVTRFRLNTGREASEINRHAVKLARARNDRNLRCSPILGIAFVIRPPQIASSSFTPSNACSALSGVHSDSHSESVHPSHH